MYAGQFWGDNKMHIMGLILLGMFAGALSGLIGIGGGIVMVPTLVLLYGMTQHQAQGTSLAVMVPPIGILAAWEYYRDGYVNVTTAGLLCIGFFIGGFFGGAIATSLSSVMLQKVFGVALILIGIKMVLTFHH